MKKLFYCILFLLPFVFQLGLIPFVNKIKPILFGLPFLHLWFFMGIVITPICTYGIYLIQKTEERSKHEG